MKRAIDFTLALLGLPVLALVTLVIAPMIKCDTGGPVFFVQRRVGSRERLFDCYKFRTMHIDSAEVPTHQSPESSITRVGRFLRSTKIDELPQLINVLVGNMSLVGPRPCLPSQLELIERRRELSVDKVLPGITGLAQVRGIDMSNPSLLARTDAEYLNRQSAMFDLKILYATLVRRAARGL